MKITICIGSSCHIKGSRQVVEQLQYLIHENKLSDKVELGGTFCMGKCSRAYASPSTTTSAARPTPSAPTPLRNSLRKTFFQRLDDL